MQILHPFAGSVTQYAEEISDPDRYRPDHCPQCGAKQPLTGHGFYCRTLVDLAFDGVIRVRRYLCRICKRTVSLLPEFALPWLRFGISVIALFLVARLLKVATLAAAALAAGQSAMPYQRGQFWIRRFQKQAPSLGVAGKVLQAGPTGEPVRLAAERTGIMDIEGRFWELCDKATRHDEAHFRKVCDDSVSADEACDGGVMVGFFSGQK